MTMLIGFFLLLLGVAMVYVVGRRRFYRRNFSGLEQFRSYEAGIVIRLIEKGGKLLGWLLILFGFGALLTTI